MLEILIPTCKPEVNDLVKAIEEQTPPPLRIITTCRQVSASANRNLCLNRCTTDVALMLDDDIAGFYPGWQADLLYAMADPQVCVASARLMTPQGMVGQTCSRCYDLEPDEIEVKPAMHCVLPTAAIAFRNLGIRFDEQYRGSGWEDNDWCFQYLQRDPSWKFIQSNRCRLIHINEQKNQSEHWQHNKWRFFQKWLGPQLQRA